MNSLHNIRARYYETFHVFVAGQLKIRKLNRYDHDTVTSSIVPYSNSFVKERLIKAEFKASAGVTENKAGFRLTGISVFEGVLPPFVITTVDLSVSSPRCYFESYKTSLCYAMALLSGPNEQQFIHYRGVWSGANTMNLGTIGPGCRLAYYKGRCMNAQKGYIIDVVEGLAKKTRTPFKEGLLSLEYFEGSEQSTKDFAYIFENNVGTKYFARCNASCKNFV